MVEPYITLFCIFQVSCKCGIILSQFKQYIKNKEKNKKPLPHSTPRTVHPKYIYSFLLFCQLHAFSLLLSSLLCSLLESKLNAFPFLFRIVQPLFFIILVPNPFPQVTSFTMSALSRYFSKDSSIQEKSCAIC